MSGKVISALEGLAAAIDDLDRPLDGRVLAEVFALADRLNAKLIAAVSEQDAAELWRNDGDTSMTAWLRHHTRCDAGIHRVVPGGRSAILDYGTTTRTVPAPLYNALVIRDRHCRFAGCDRPPDWTEAHHVRWITRGGPTALDNLVLLCSRHHHLLHTPGWDAKLLPDTTLRVTDPTGHVHTSHPPNQRPPLPLRE